MKRLLRLVLLGGAMCAGPFAPLSGLDAQPRPDPPQRPGKPPAPAAEAKPGPAALEPATPDGVAFFEKRICPVLVRECYACHATTAKKVKGGLMLDTRDGLRAGGNGGPAIVPGDPKRSRLIQAIKHAEDDLMMPPKKKLDAAVIADFEKWVSLGAPDPRDGTAPAPVAKGGVDVEKGRRFWAFQPPRRPDPPAVKDAAWPWDPIDRFVLAAQEARGLRPVAAADARTLIRRVYFDLVGLPPTPEEVEAFVAADAAGRPAALGAIVDRLLASPRFGERWGRHWLDVVRYAESSGRAVNLAYPHAWRYRDYVIAAFNADKPYDQFIREQLAGDLLPPSPYPLPPAGGEGRVRGDDRQKAEFLVATGFLAIGPKSHDERNPRQFQMDLADEQIDATFQAFQGLTVACARCHDHKFDPISQKDYYALAGIFRSTETCYGTIRIIQSNHPSALITLPREAGATAALEPLSAERRAGIEKQIDELRDQIAKLTGRDAFLRSIFARTRRALLQSQLTLYEADGTPKPLAMGVRERGFASDGRVYVRGELDQPGEVVRRGFPEVLTTRQPAIGRGSGRRELAEWIASHDNPLTARVMANRVWLHLMGRGLVPTPDNFGASGQPPSHPALLDHLAVTFQDHGLSVKKLIRTIVLSRVYQLSAQFDEANFEADPDNVLVWRMPKRRLEAEALRDTMLALAGRLDLTPPKGSSVARGGEGNAGFRFRTVGDAAGADTHRTVYLAVVRDALPEALTLFDFPDPSLIIGERTTTMVPAQALYLLNNPFVIRQAEALADRLLAGGGDDAGQITRAYQLCYARPPSAREHEKARQFLDDYSRSQTRRAAWAALCQALFASAEFSHR
jgi:hypothetical protein